MLIRLISLAVLVSLPAVSGGQTNSPREGPPPAPATDLKPFTIAVVDLKTGKPVTEFSYQFGYITPGRVSPVKKDWQPVQSPSGAFVVQTPPACRVVVGVRSRDVMAGSTQFHEIVIRSTDNARRAIVELERGATVHGTVRDATTRKPIAGATVSPKVFYENPYASIEERQATSDRYGHYQLRGVDPKLGVSASNPDYGGPDDGVDVKKTDESLFDVYLKPLRHVTLRGTVRDSNGHPLEGVTVSDNEKHVQTTREGTYALHFALGRLGYYSISAQTYSKEGYVTRELAGDEVDKDGLVVELKRQVPLEGQVLGPDGQPVKSFEVCAVLGGASSEYLRLRSVERTVKDTAGRFRLGLDREGRTWVGVRASGYASWAVWTDVPRSGGSLVVRLEAGVPISGRILVPPGGLAKLQARLVPRRAPEAVRGLVGSISDVKNWVALTTTVAADGTLRFDHVRPDRYTLGLYGPGVTPRLLAFDVPAGGLDLGQVRLAGRGRVEGRGFRTNQRGDVWSFAEGRARSPDFPFGEEVEFMSDEDGRFSVGGVPVGLVKVGFPYWANDVGNAEEWVVQVCEDQTTEVRLLDPVGSRPLPVEFRIGDGSKAQYESGTGLGAKRRVDNVKEQAPMFRVDLMPRSRQPLSFVDPDWVRLDAKRQVVLSDVSPGAYRLRVIDWLGRLGLEDGALFERDITVPTDALPVKVSLGGGSITGRFLGAGDFEEKVEVIAVARGGQGPTRRTRCDTNGNYCVRYLDPGTYTLFAHFPKGSWSRVDNLTVASDATDVGERPLSRGGTIRGSISFRRPCPVPDEVVATGPSQVSLKLPFEHYSSFDQFELGGLWPGRWTITVRSGEEVLATANAEISGTETVSVELAAETEKRP
ncbi:MAG: hypothetical protein ACHRXM_25130 [Isosphaerales bacterium]